MTPAEAVSAASAIIRKHAHIQPLIVAIDGGGGAGKSTLARGISEEFAGRVAIARCDDFYRPLNSDLSAEDAYHRYFDWRRLRDEGLAPLRERRSARYRRYDWSTDQLAEWIEIEPREIVVVEGVFSTRPELRPSIDVAIFVATPRDLRIRRMLARAQPSTSWLNKWLIAEDWYLEHIAPDRNADLVLEGF